MSLIVRFHHGELIGAPISRSHFDDGSEVGTFNDYLKKMSDNWRWALADGLRTFSHLRWNGKIYAKDSPVRNLLQEVVKPIIENRDMTTDIDQNILTRLGTPTIEAFEEALYELLQEIALLDKATQI